jgi:proline dehydrogenase
VPKRLVGLFAQRYIAGDSLDKAIRKTKELNDLGAMTTIDILGEAVKSAQEAEKIVDTYLQVLQQIQANNLQSNISIKPSSFGFLVNENLCFESIQKIVSAASEPGHFVRIDMEDHLLTDFTLNTYRKLRVQFPQNVGTVLQSYLKRTVEDASLLIESGKTNLRLCKGIYVEPETIAYKDRKKINESYLRALDILFSKGGYVGIATHDNALVSGALELIKKYKLAREQYEFQMLLGVRPELMHRILETGHRIRIYVPFGKDWYPYSTRRLKENPAIVGNIVKGFMPRFLCGEKLPF